jgi:hypothetical protein
MAQNEQTFEEDSMRIISAALLATCLVSPTWANPTWEQYCKENETIASRSASIARVVDGLGQALLLMEGIPPGVAAYFDQEVHLSTAQPSAEAADRLIAASRHPSWPAYNVQSMYHILAKQMRAASQAQSVADQVIYLSDALSSHASLMGAFEQYDSFDKERPKRLLSDDATRNILFNLMNSSGQILLALKCGVRQMREPQ